MYSIELIERWERLAGYSAVALAKFRSEEELKSSEARYRGLFENIQEIVALSRFVIGSDGEIVDLELIDINPAALKAYGIGSVTRQGERGTANYTPRDRCSRCSKA